MHLKTLNIFYEKHQTFLLVARLRPKLLAVFGWKFLHLLKRRSRFERASETSRTFLDNKAGKFLVATHRCESVLGDLGLATFSRAEKACCTELSFALVAR